MATANRTKKAWKSVARQDLEAWIKEGRAQAKLIGLRHIRLDFAFQARVEVNQEHVQSLCGMIDVTVESGVEALLSLAHIIIFKCMKTGRLIVADGFHRVLAYRKRGLENIRAWVIESKNAEHEARLYCVSANLELSLSPSLADRRKAVRIMIEDPIYREWSDSEISRRCGVGPKLVGNVRDDLRIEKGIPIPVMTWSFKNHQPTQKVPYRDSVDPKTRTIGKHTPPKGGGRPKFRTGLNGKRTDLGSDPSKVHERINRALALQQDSQKAKFPAYILSDCSSMVTWLRRQGIDAKAIRSDEAKTGGFRVPGAICRAVDGVDQDCYLKAIGSLFMALKLDRIPSRLVIVGLHNQANPTTCSMFNVAKREPNPVEFMTPEEVVAAFGGTPEPDDDAGSELTDAERAMEDRIDLADAQAAIAEPGENIPWDEVKARR